MAKPRQPSSDGSRGKGSRQAPAASEDFAPLEIATHRALAGKMREIVRRLDARPDLAVMLFINPALVFKDLAVSLAPDLVHHVLHSTQHPPELRRRREELEGSLARELGEPPRPLDPGWVSDLLFRKLRLAPLATAGHEPVYRPPLDPEVIDRLRKLRPQPKARYAGTRRLNKVATVRVAAWRPAVRRMDLDAPLPAIEPAREPPAEVTLEGLYFYKDSHPIARQVLELGIIQRRSFPFHSPDSYRRIRDGEKPNAFRAWIRAVRFPER